MSNKDDITLRSIRVQLEKDPEFNAAWTQRKAEIREELDAVPLKTKMENGRAPAIKAYFANHPGAKLTESEIQSVTRQHIEWSETQYFDRQKNQFVTAWMKDPEVVKQQLAENLAERQQLPGRVAAYKEAERERVSDTGMNRVAAHAKAQNIPKENRYAELNQHGARNEFNIPENIVGVDRPRPIDPLARQTSPELRRLDHQQKNEARHRGEALDRMAKCQEQRKPVDVKEFNHLYRDEVAKIRTDGAKELSSMIQERQRQNENER